MFASVGYSYRAPPGAAVSCPRLHHQQICPAVNSKPRFCDAIRERTAAWTRDEMRATALRMRRCLAHAHNGLQYKCWIYQLVTNSTLCFMIDLCVQLSFVSATTLNGCSLRHAKWVLEAIMLKMHTICSLYRYYAVARDKLTIDYWIRQVCSFILFLVLQTPKWPVLVSIIDLMDAPNVHCFTDSYNWCFTDFTDKYQLTEWLVQFHELPLYM